MSEELTVQNELEELSNVVAGMTKTELDESLEQLCGGSTFQRIQLFGSSSNAVKEGKIAMGHFAIVDSSNMIDLGESFDCLILGYRMKAICFGDDVEVNFDPTSPRFIEMVKESAVKDSDCVFGPEYLLYIPERGYVPYHLNNVSSQYESKAFRALVGKNATVRASLIKGKKGTYHAPKVAACNVPFPLPNIDEVKRILADFNNPKGTEVAEKVEETVER